jgi:hypothetical protein
MLEEANCILPRDILDEESQVPSRHPQDSLPLERQSVPTRSAGVFLWLYHRSKAIRGRSGTTITVAIALIDDGMRITRG